MASSVEKRMALTFPVFRLERFAIEMPTRSESSVSEIFRSAMMRSSRNTIAMFRLSENFVSFGLQRKGFRQQFGEDQKQDTGQQKDRIEKEEGGAR